MARSTCKLPVPELEGTTADILAVVGELHAVPFEINVPSVYPVLKLNAPRDRPQTLEDKVASVQRRLADGCDIALRPPLAVIAQCSSQPSAVPAPSRAVR